MKQVIPGNTIGSFELSFVSNTPKKFKQVIDYKINYNYNFQFLASARCINCELKFSKHTFNFKFSDNSYELKSYDRLKLKNEGNSAVK